MRPPKLSLSLRCRAVRFKVSVPPFEDRPLSPYKTPGLELPDSVQPRFPMSVLCHCNGCRAATAQIGVSGMPTHAPTVSVSVLGPKTGSDGSLAAPVSDDERTWTSWASMSSKFSADETSPLKRYESSPGRWRYFCGVCGSPIGYEVDPTSLPAELNWPHVVMLWTGALDRSILEKDWVRPDHIMFTSFGIPWVREQVKNGVHGAQEHPFILVDQPMGKESIEKILPMVRGTGINDEITIWE
ncbi:hypothetical protein CEP52_005355 [Fusarium oligoseptatum]|uniref:CENP-V/GFA domain-containing protein n=1 Tax=Fusarium oligoseptatum TaxID=2604345 RepID=A0A428TZ17_9HYPO|nr:hypothetical protein CEP52_005355 [Fusarium oligoseptatum]